MKAVIMAGGEGSRLRPLTCNLPKPMARLCGKPVVEYILELLKKHDCDEAALTLGYLPDMIINHFPNDEYKGIKLDFVEEKTPLGTAGGVLNAANNFNEPFVVISGDAMCDFDLTKAMEFHLNSSALVTIIVKNVDDPREYGLVTADDSGRVTGFVEKPDWSGVTTGLANTGIYIIDPDVLDMIPFDTKYDFAADLFPQMLGKQLKISMFEADGYWCDIGDLSAYVQCQRDIMSGYVETSLTENRETGCFGVDKPPEGDYKIFPPVYFGDRVIIGEGAIIGPDAVIEDGVVIGNGARVRLSVLLSDCRVDKNARVTEAVICSGATIKNSAGVYEGAIIGAGTVVGENAEILPEVSIWPKKIVEDSATVIENLKFGNIKTELFDDDGISGEAGSEMTPELCVRVGAAAGSLKKGKRIGLGYLGGNAAKALKSAVASGVLSTGSQIWDFGCLNEAQMNFAASYCGLEVALYITDGEKCSIKVVGKNGLSASRNIERELQQHLKRGEFIRVNWTGYRDIADMKGMKLLYQQELYRIAPHGLGGIKTGIRCQSNDDEKMLRDTLTRLGCEICPGNGNFSISRNGTRLTYSDDRGMIISHDQLLAICCLLEFEKGNDVALPFESPRIIAELAARFSCGVKRYHTSPGDGSDTTARELAGTQHWVRDGMMMAIKLLADEKENGRNLGELYSVLPEFSSVKRNFRIKRRPAELMRKLGEKYTNAGDGVIIKSKDADLLLRPQKNGRGIALYAEAISTEAAEALCDEVESAVRKMTDFNK